MSELKRTRLYNAHVAAGATNYYRFVATTTDGGHDQTVPPAKNAELFAARFKEAGGRIEVVKRGAFGHHPHGVDPDKTATITKFVTTAK